MPCIKIGKSGWKIQKMKGGMYPKLYPDLSACKMRVSQMESHKKMKKK